MPAPTTTSASTRTRKPVASSVGDRLRDDCVVPRDGGDVLGHLIHLAPGQLAQDQFVPCERSRYSDDRQIERHPQPVEARAAVLPESVVVAESGGERGFEGVALAAVLAVELLPPLEAGWDSRCAD